MSRLARFLLNLAFFLALIAGAAIIWRVELVETGARRYAAALGLEDARFEVRAVTRDAVVIEDATLGDGALAARRVRISFDLAGLAAGRPNEVEITGLRVNADSPVFSRLQALGGGDGPPAAPPRVVLEDAVLRIAAPLPGEVTVAGVLDLSAPAPTADLRVEVALAQGGGAFTLRSADLAAGGMIEIAGAGEADLAGLALPGDATMAAGRARFKLSGEAQAPEADPASLAAWLAAAHRLEAEAQIAGAAIAEGAETASLDIAWRQHGGPDGLRVTLPRPARAAVTGLTAETLAALRLPADGPRDLEITVSADDPALILSTTPEGGSARLTATISARRGETTAEADLAIASRHDRGGALTAPAQIALRAAIASLAFAGPEGEVVIDGATFDGAATLAPDGGVSFEGPLAIAAHDLRGDGFAAAEARIDGVVQGEGRSAAEWTFSADPGLTLALNDAAAAGVGTLTGPALAAVERLHASASAQGVRLDVAAATDGLSGVLAGGEAPLTIESARARVAADLLIGATTTGAIRIEDGGADLPATAIALRSVAADLPLPADGARAPMRLSGEVLDLARPPRFAPFALDLEGESDGRDAILSGAASLAGGAVRAPLAGRASLAEGTLAAEVGPVVVAFAKDGLQPAALSPALAMLRNARGAVRADGAATLAADGALAFSAGLRFDDFSARMDDLDVIGLSGDLRFGQFAPLATAGRQRLTARRIFAGAPIDSVRLVFTIPPRRRGLTVRLEELRGDLAGGEVMIADAVWDSRAGRNSLAVQVADVAIARLLEEWRVEGVTGSGQLSGVIPIQIGRDGVTVDAGRLASTGPGVIKVDFGPARERLAGAGEQVALAVAALEDFHYTTLTLALDQADDDGLAIAIGLDGANPAVLDGYPFRFNVTLSGDLGELLQAVREGRAIGGGLLRGGLGGN